MLLSFESLTGRHTGKAIGEEFLMIIKKFNLQDKLVSKLTMLLCISHTIHLGPCHFIKKLNVPGILAAKRQARQKSAQNQSMSLPSEDKYYNNDKQANDTEEEGKKFDNYNDFDVDLNMSVEADTSNPAKVLSTRCIKPRKLKLWVKTHWESLADCYLHEVIDQFIHLAELRLGPLQNKKHKWIDFTFMK
ncbi:hypothetical protein CVT24_004157 [Panaeolus cyanescens]|uniref:Uncharacterized protein n=1 Tax=Panaeolus cyanescens TaxID=181874 RepID=A0A409Y6R7_9AGAR|nr:hypothetical protein CVT24_004157 [Panaeolus cyanescens]